MISDDEVQRAVDWLRDNASRAGKARAAREYLGEYTKALKAKLMRRYTDLPVAAQEREALASEEYVDHLHALATAIEDDEQLRWLRAAAEAKLEAWRTFSANERTTV